MFRVQFDEETGLERYSGCYRYERGNSFIESDGRLVYSNKDEAQETAMLGYCHADRTWVFVNYNESDPNQDFCDSTKGEIAHSEKTNSYDFSSAFEIGWKSPFNKPLDVYFIDNPGNKNGDNGFFECDSIANDGKCDKALNNFDYKYDGGDCCATTCTHADCHPEEANQAFGEDTPGAKQFQSCIDPDMVDLTIYLTRYNSKGIPEWARNSNYNDLEEWKSNWKPPSLLLECNGNVVFSVPVNPILSDITEPSEQSPSIIAKVEPDAICNLNISNFLTVWDINVEVNDDRVTTNTLSSSIPSEIGRLTNLMALNMGNQSLAGTIPVNITHLHLEELDLQFDEIEIRF
ncbi:unnamed protein product [Pseudo-nitzschia multistriata]|uniref:LNR domain-containing protein n=1 Tax=Pseudo-nitzschia multistriata TaxID=183589 RepID=A0A448YXX6_9STRA|nr:unnamed protein product [Pseudo-nitzschia multistriata]